MPLFKGLVATCGTGEEKLHRPCTHMHSAGASIPLSLRRKYPLLTSPSSLIFLFPFPFPLFLSCPIPLYCGYGSWRALKLPRRVWGRVRLPKAFWCILVHDAFGEASAANNDGDILLADLHKWVILYASNFNKDIWNMNFGISPLVIIKFHSGAKWRQFASTPPCRRRWRRVIGEH